MNRPHDSGAATPRTKPPWTAVAEPRQGRRHRFGTARSAAPAVAGPGAPGPESGVGAALCRRTPKARGRDEAASSDGAPFRAKRYGVRRVTAPLFRAAQAIAAAALVLAAAIALAPLPHALLQPPPHSLELTDRHGTLLREILDDDGRYAKPIALPAISPHLIRATLAAEDKRFYRHPGVDPLAIARAAWDGIRHGRVVSGGSTITQQLIKITSGAHGRRTPWTKLVETITAIKLDALWSKDRILDAYLNRVDYGNSRLGCAAAARFYFDKPAADLSVAEAAQLAALPRSPARLNPLRHPAAARDAQQLVLGRMLRNRWISFGDYLAALDEHVDPGARRVVFRAPHFADLALAQAGARTGLAATTLDLDLNAFIETRLRSRLAALADCRVSNGAAVVIDNRAGELLALIGSENYFRPGCGQVNAATAPRSAGSTLKPFTYLLAIERGHTPASLLADTPSEFPTPTGMFRPVNFDQSFRGPVRLRTALANSLNVPAVRLLASLGGPGTLAAALRASGLTSLHHPADHYGLGLTIGNAEVRLLELANAYACLARLGLYRPLRLFANGPAPDAPEEHRLFDRDAAWLIADILNDDFARAPAFGPRSGLAIGFPVACKTGTSSDFRDNWAFGFTPEFTVGVWVGNFDGSPMRGVSGVTGAAPLLRDIFRHLRQTRGTSWYPKPHRIVEAKIHPITGKRTRPGQPGITEHFILPNLPPLDSPADYDPNGRPRLGEEFAAWLATAKPSHLASASPDSPTILSPRDGATYFLDPDLPGSHTLPLRANVPTPLAWHSDTLAIEDRPDGPLARLTIGRHHIFAQDPQTGRQTRSSIEVRGM